MAIASALQNQQDELNDGPRKTSTKTFDAPPQRLSELFLTLRNWNRGVPRLGHWNVTLGGAPQNRIQRLGVSGIRDRKVERRRFFRPRCISCIRLIDHAVVAIAIIRLERRPVARSTEQRR